MSFLNWLTITNALASFDDGILKWIFPMATYNESRQAEEAAEANRDDFKQLICMIADRLVIRIPAAFRPQVEESIPDDPEQKSKSDNKGIQSILRKQKSWKMIGHSARASIHFGLALLIIKLSVPVISNLVRLGCISQRILRNRLR